MADDLAFLAELPEPQRSDRIIAAFRTLVSGVPWVEGSIAELWSGFLNSPLTRRRDEWLKRLAKVVIELHDNHPNLTPEQLLNNDQFLSAVLNTTNLALRTHQQFKLHALHQAVRSAILNSDIEEDQQAIFTRYIDDLTPWHLRMLMFFHDPNVHLRRRGFSEPWLVEVDGHQGVWSTNKKTQILLERGFAELGHEFQFRSQLIQDLGLRQLICVSTVGQDLPDIGPYTTTTGQRFIRFAGLESFDN